MTCQQQLNWCWAAVSAAVRQYRPTLSPVTQCEIANEVMRRNDCCANSSGCNVEQKLQDALGSKLVQTIPGPVNFDVVKLQIELNRPVCARIMWDPDGDDREEDGAHFVVIDGYDEATQYLSVRDPDCGETQSSTHRPAQSDSRELPFEEFKNAYRLTGVWVATFLVKGEPS